MPAMLNVLVGAPKVMLHRAAASETEAKGVWRLSHRAMSQPEMALLSTGPLRQ